MTLTPYPIRYKPLAVTKDGVICNIEAIQVNVAGNHGHYGGWNNGKHVLVPFEQFEKIKPVKVRGFDKIVDDAMRRAALHLSRKQQDSASESQTTRADIGKGGASKANV